MDKSHLTVFCEQSLFFETLRTSCHKLKSNNLFSLLLQGYVVRISGGNDKQGFPMKQGVLTHGRVRLLLSKGHSCYRPRRTGERKRKSVRGCIVDANLSVLNLVIIKKGNVFFLARRPLSGNRNLDTEAYY